MRCRGAHAPAGVEPSLDPSLVQYMAELGAYERHFNDIQSRYRTLASTWLLGAVAASGFILTNDVGVSPALLVGGSRSATVRSETCAGR